MAVKLLSSNMYNLQRTVHVSPLHIKKKKKIMKKEYKTMMMEIANLNTPNLLAGSERGVPLDGTPNSGEMHSRDFAFDEEYEDEEVW